MSARSPAGTGSAQATGHPPAPGAPATAPGTCASGPTAGRSPIPERPGPRAAPSADIFCRVVDNYGDIGVCWRLARRLAHDEGWTVRLWVDDLASFARLAPGAAPGDVDGIELIHWTAHAPVPIPHDVVIEAFACDPPAAYRAQLTPRHVWFNLEYLSAESWVEGCHALPSPQGGGVDKIFFFPGFTARTGGLLREPDLLARRDAFQQDGAARAAFLQRIGFAAEDARAIAAGQLDLYPVFCYPGAPLDAWRDAIATLGRPAMLALAGTGTPAACATPHGVAPARPPGEPAPAEGTDADGRRDTAGVRALALPFLPHADFDRLLWCGTLNIVRGEDSFVRAQWAARPMLWHIYPQDEDAHLEKLAAWLARVAPPASVTDLHVAWNTGDAATLARAWPAARGTDWSDWSARMADWSRHLAHDVPELARALADFTRDRVEC